VSSSASSPPSGGPFAPSEVVREIGARPHPVYVVRYPAAGAGGKPQLAIAERYEGAAAPGNAAGEQLLREARRIATLASPNLPRVREVVTRGDAVVVFSEFIEGEKLLELWQSGKLPLEIALRVIVDALTGAGAIHNLRDAKQQPMKLAHGEIAPATIVLGLDGVGRLLHAIARRAPDAAPEAASYGHLAPEVLCGEPYDARADVFSAGVLLWEALSGKRLFPDASPATAADVARRIRAGEIPAATVPEKATWAKGLVAVAAKALAAAPDDRWPTAAVLAAEIRKAAGLKLAPASTAAAFARSGMGERAKARREALDGSSVPPSALAAHSPPPAAAAPVEPSPPPPKLAEPAQPAETNESVLVAPGIRAPVEEVVELESSLLVAAPDSIAPPAQPAPSSAVGGFVLDPFAAAASLAKSPPPPFAQPAPAPAPAPVHFAVADAQPISLSGSDLQPEPPSSVTGAPHFAAAIDVQPPPAPAPAPMPRAPVEAFAVASPDEPVELPRRGAGRRTAVILGGVAALGLVVFGLAAIRIATRSNDSAPATARPSVANVQPVAPTETAPAPAPSRPADTVASASSAPSQVAPSPSPPPAQVAPSPTPPPAQVAPAQAPPPRMAPAPVPAPTPNRAVVATPPRATPTAAPTAAKPRPKPTFDPNSL